MKNSFLKFLLIAILGGFVAALFTTGVFYLHILPKHSFAQQTAPNEKASFASFASTPENFRKAASKSMAGVVHISTLEETQRTLWDYYTGRGPQLREGTGSGVIYSSDGYIVTNNHVVGGAQQIFVTLNDGRKLKAQLIGTYAPADLAVIKVEPAGLFALSFANSDEAEVGDWVLAVGNPYNLSSTVTAGIISARGRDIGIINDRNAIESFIQTDAAINPGNSGGALVDVDGNVIGINTAIYSRSGGYTGYGFAIPSNLAARIAEDIITTGSYQQVVLGIEASELDEAYARELGINFNQGVVIEALAPKGLAASSGIEVGDIIVGVDNRDLRSLAEFREAVSSSPRGTDLLLRINRDGRILSLTLKL